MFTSSLARRAGAFVTGGALAVAGLSFVAPAPLAHAAPAPAPEAEAAAAWLDGQLDEDGLFTYLDPWSGETVTDIGTTLDYGLSLLATGASPASVDAIATAVGARMSDYVGASYDPTKSSAVAKAAAFYLEAGVDSLVVEGINLAERLEDSVEDSGEARGRLGTSPAGDVYGQVWAVRTLDALGSAEADEAAAYLIGQRCEGAGWGYEFGGTCTSAVDGTAYVVHALLPQVSFSSAARFAVEDAVAWLKQNQRADGGFGDWGVNNNGTTSEANGTGLAGWVLGEAGETEAAASAASWLAGHQVTAVPGCGTSGVTGHLGALGYDDKSIADALRFGIAAEDRQAWILAGAQGLAGLAYLAAAAPAAPVINGPTGYLRAGSTVTLTVQGLRPGQVACVSGLGAPQWVVTRGSVTVVLPAGTAQRTVALRHATGATTVTLKALGAQALKVKAKAKVKAKKKLAVKVTRLAPGERVTVKVGKRSVAGIANGKGAATIKVKVGKKKGKTKIKVTGQFPDRTGKAPVRVV